MTTTPPPVFPKRPALWPLRITTIALALLLFFIACFFPAFYYVKPNGDPSEPSLGFTALLIGPMAIFYGCVAWYANLILFLSWIFILCRLWLTAAIITAFAILIAFNSYSLIGKPIDADESGGHKIIAINLGPAFHIWLAAFIVTLLGCLLLKILGRKPRQIAPPV